MNLHGIVKGAVASVNPIISGQLYASAGYTTAADGSQDPQYGSPQNVELQIQALQYNDIVQLDGLNIQGERRAVYLNGHWDGVIRADQKGGDLLVFPEVPGGAPRTWLVVFVFEHWPDWSKLAVTLQMDGVP